jgi:hypothetical protein
MLAKDSVDTRQVRDEVLADEEAHQRAANLLAQVPTGSVGIPQCRNSGGGTDKRRVRLVEDARAADALPVGDEALKEVVLRVASCRSGFALSALKRSPLSSFVAKAVSCFLRAAARLRWRAASL